MGFIKDVRREQREKRKAAAVKVRKIARTHRSTKEVVPGSPNFVTETARGIDEGSERFNRGLRRAADERFVGDRRRKKRGSSVVKNIAKKEAGAIKVHKIKPLRF